MLPEFLDIKTIYTIMHVFGAVLGAGGAFMSDAMFFSTVKDGVIEKTELRFMKLGGKMVWTGLLVLIVSGVLLLSLNPAYYLASTKFLVKATVVGVIILNGFVFHLIHIKKIQHILGRRLAQSPSFVKNSSFLMISGAVSMVSWVSTLVLGMLKQVPYTYLQIFSVYIAIVLFAATVSLFVKRRLFDLK